MRIMDEARLQLELKEWKNKSWSIPELQGGKHVWYELIKRFVNLL